MAVLYSVHIYLDVEKRENTKVENLMKLHHTLGT